jgi:TonB family protein
VKFAHVFVATALAFAFPAHAEPSKEIPSEDRDAQPLRPPTPSYPELAARVGMPGRCIVRFDVTSDGLPINIVPHCTYTVFCKSAADAVAQVKFAPKVVGGQRLERVDVVYPLEYRIGNTQEEIEASYLLIRDKPLKPCLGGLVS